MLILLQLYRLCRGVAVNAAASVQMQRLLSVAARVADDFECHEGLSSAFAADLRLQIFLHNRQVDACCSLELRQNPIWTLDQPENWLLELTRSLMRRCHRSSQRLQITKVHPREEEVPK